MRARSYGSARRCGGRLGECPSPRPRGLAERSTHQESSRLLNPQVAFYMLLPAHRNQSATVSPHIALKTNTNRGVRMPRSSPIYPLWALRGKTTKSCTIVGPKLKTTPRDRIRFLRTGSRKRNPHMPPQTIRGYSHGAERVGAIVTPKPEVIPRLPQSQTARLFKSPPRQPAANTKDIFLTRVLMLISSSISDPKGLSGHYSKRSRVFSQTPRPLSIASQTSLTAPAPPLAAVTISASWSSIS